MLAFSQTTKISEGVVYCIMIGQNSAKAIRFKSLFLIQSFWCRITEFHWHFSEKIASPSTYKKNVMSSLTFPIAISREGYVFGGITSLTTVLSCNNNIDNNFIIILIVHKRQKQNNK